MILNKSYYPPGSRIFDRYEIVSRPLIGGMGIVYICNDLKENQPVALKTFRSELLSNQMARERFLREGTTWINLGSHPHIVKAYRIVRIDEGLETYLVLELVAKEEGSKDASLRSKLIPGKPLPVGQALLFGLQVARGMAYATKKIPGLVHRDLKPENILVGSDRLINTKINRLRITDFGLVGVLARDNEMSFANSSRGPQNTGHRILTKMDGFVGTPEYASPEQFRNEPLDVRCDIYAFGCIFYEMLTGHPPFIQTWKTQEERFTSYCNCHLNQQPHALHSINSSLPFDLKELVMHCLEKERDKRYSTWYQIEEAIAAVYNSLIGQKPPNEEKGEVLSRSERLAAGWSYSYLGFSYLEIGKPTFAVDYFKQAAEIGEDENDPSLHATGLNNLGVAYNTPGYLQKAIAFGEQALILARQGDDLNTEASVWGNLGKSYSAVGKKELSIDCLKKALNLFRRTGDKNGEAGTLINLSSDYKDLGNYQYAVMLCEEAIDIAREAKNRRWLANGFDNLGLAYSDMGDFDRAIELHSESLAICREIVDRDGEAASLINLGFCYERKYDFAQAIQLFQEGLEISREIGNKMWELQATNGIGLIYSMLGNLKESLKNLELSLQIACEIGDAVGIVRLNFTIAVLLKQQGYFIEALPYAEHALEACANIGNMEVEKEVQQLVAQIREGMN